MVIKYCQKFGDSSLAAGKIQLWRPFTVYIAISECASDDEMYELARQFPLVKSSIPEFHAIAEQLYGTEVAAANREFRRENCKDMQELGQHILVAMTAGHPALVCAKSPLGAHITPVVGVDSGIIEIWDVAGGGFKSINLVDDEMNREFVVLEEMAVTQ